jgi:lipoprotein-anchoring transpeptidase ErfK/SrfK
LAPAAIAAVLFAACAAQASSVLASRTFEDIFSDRAVQHAPVSPSAVERDGPRERSGAFIEVHTSRRVLYLNTAEGTTIRYRVGVGRAGQQWFGSTRIVSKRLKPAWTPPKVIRGDKAAWVVPPGSPKNPMGAAALVLADHELAIHGTNDPNSIGGFVSWGCIRMQNRDVLDLFKRVNVGTPVVIKR